MAQLVAVQKLIQAFGKLPGIGRRSAQRMAYCVARERGELAVNLLSSIQEVCDTVRSCNLCGHLTTVDENPCVLCTDTERDLSMLCVVEDPRDILLIEQAGAYRGRYHALMGKISPAQNQGLPSLQIDKLLKRVNGEPIQEVILALNADVESDATASYLYDLLLKQGIRVSRLANGIPVGSGVSYADPITLSRAFRGRQAMS